MSQRISWDSVAVTPIHALLRRADVVCQDGEYPSTFDLARLATTVRPDNVIEVRTAVDRLRLRFSTVCIAVGGSFVLTVFAMQLNHWWLVPIAAVVAIAWAAIMHRVMVLGSVARSSLRITVDADRVLTHLVDGWHAAVGDQLCVLVVRGSSRLPAVDADQTFGSGNVSGVQICLAQRDDTTRRLLLWSVRRASRRRRTEASDLARALGLEYVVDLRD